MNLSPKANWICCIAALGAHLTFGIALAQPASPTGRPADQPEIWAEGLKPILTELLGPPAKTDHAPPPTGDPSAGRK